MIPMVSSNEKRCRSCGSAILWVETEAGKKMPLDLEPELRVVVEVVTGLDGGRKEVGRVVKTYISHFATCPNADEHRRTT